MVCFAPHVSVSFRVRETARVYSASVPVPASAQPLQRLRPPRSAHRPPSRPDAPGVVRAPQSDILFGEWPRRSRATSNGPGH